MRRKRAQFGTDLGTLWWRNALKTWEIVVAAPQVIAHRTARMAAAGSSPSARDRKEFTRMSQEKIDAFGESLFAMAAPMFKMHQEFALLAMRQWWSTWANPALLAGASPERIAKAHATFMRKLAAGATSKQIQDSFSRMVGKGLAPVHKRATANAKRLKGF